MLRIRTAYNPYSDLTGPQIALVRKQDRALGTYRGLGRSKYTRHVGKKQLAKAAQGGLSQ